MKVLFTILALVLVAPMLVLVGVALGPAILVTLFIAGFALVEGGLVWLIDRVRTRHKRHAPLHT